MIRVHRNYDPVTLEKGTEAISFYFLGFGLELRWKSCEDGTTPDWSVWAWRNGKTIFSIG